jgi:hypothetical protein
MTYGWMKFVYFLLHPLIVHALGVRWPSALCFRNALWEAYNVVHLLVVFNDTSIWSDVLNWKAHIFFGILDFVHAIEARCRIPKWFGTCSWDTFWMSYCWMKFEILIFHLWIVHPFIVQWSCILCLWNALWMAYRMECLFVAVYKTHMGHIH